MKRIHRLKAQRYRRREADAGRLWPDFTESDAAISRDQCGHSRRTCERADTRVELYACDMHAEQLVEQLVEAWHE